MKSTRTDTRTKYLASFCRGASCAILFSVLTPTLTPCFGNVTLPAIISNNMVLRKSRDVPVWGKADPGEQITVTLGDQKVSATADQSGRWKAVLNLESSGAGPFEMTVEGKNRLVVSNVAIGEVWLASGQSNMEWVLAETADAKTEIAGSKNPLIRQFVVRRASSAEPLEDVKGTWQEASPQTSAAFSAVAYYFAKHLSAETGGPIGVIASAWGGTAIEYWLSPDAVEMFPEVREQRKSLLKRVQKQTALQKNYISDIRPWVETHRRLDQPTPDPSIYAGPGVDLSGWTPVSVPGEISSGGLPKTGIVWLRREIEIPADGGPPQINLPLDGFDSVYWNGHLLRQTTFESYPGDGKFRNLRATKDIPFQQKNVLAIRLYAPAGPGRFTKVPALQDLTGKKELPDGWFAKAERAFPDLDAQTLAQAPKPADAPPPGEKIPCALFNAMIAPLVNTSIDGVIWYQGEANAGNPTLYRKTFPGLISDWRKKWNLGDLPFYFCQLAAHHPKISEPGESGWAALREAQSSVLGLPNTAQVVLIDAGEAGDPHPRDKSLVGKRLANIALAKLHARKISFSGPVLDSCRFEDGKAVLTFRHADGGLVARPLPETYIISSVYKKSAPLVRNSPGSELEGFQICGEDKKWVWADAKIEGDTVIVFSDKIGTPSAVRYAWADNPTANLFNGEGLPASPFRTDQD